MKINIETDDGKEASATEAVSSKAESSEPVTDAPYVNDNTGEADKSAETTVDAKETGLESKNKEYLDHLQRLQAEFENYKRRTNKEKSETIKYANGRLAERLLAVVDNLQRGLKLSAGNEAAAEIINGMRLVEKQLIDILSEFGVTAFDVLGERFDPNIHEPVYTVERGDVEADIVVEEMEKGYMIHEKLLRAAKVAVSRAPSPESA